MLLRYQGRGLANSRSISPAVCASHGWTNIAPDTDQHSQSFLPRFSKVVLNMDLLCRPGTWFGKPRSISRSLCLTAGPTYARHANLPLALHCIHGPCRVYTAVTQDPAASAFLTALLTRLMLPVAYCDRESSDAAFAGAAAADQWCSYCRPRVHARDAARAWRKGAWARRVGQGPACSVAG
jgi:hypothetical protein